MLIIRQLLDNRDTVFHLEPQHSLRSAAQFLRDHKIGGAPVLDGERIAGFCSERDLVHQAMADGLDPETATVADVMTREVVTAQLEETVVQGEERMRAAHCRHIPILDGEKLVGCLSLRDFLQSELRDCEIRIEHLENYIQGAG